MKKLSIIAGALAATLSCTVAQSADMAVKAPIIVPIQAYNWTGFYMSVGAGGLWGDSDWVYTNGTTPSHSFNNAIGSVSLGYQHQFGNIGMGGAAIVLGIEAAGTWAFGDFNEGAACPNASFTCQTKITGLFTAGGKLGLAWQNFMLYGTGGYAYGQVNTRTPSVATGVAFDYTDRYQDGWYAGAGLDWMAHKTRAVDVIVGVEYQHVDLGNRLHIAPLASEWRTVDVTAEIVKAKLTLKINP